MNRKRGFTLIELIIVIVIVGILAVVAIPRFFANIEKARKAEAVSTMSAIREVLQGYYALNNAYPAAGTFPITVVIDGETVSTLTRPSSPNFVFNYTATAVSATHSATGGSCDYTMNISTAAIGKTPASCP